MTMEKNQVALDVTIQFLQQAPADQGLTNPVIFRSHIGNVNSTVRHRQIFFTASTLLWNY